MCAGVRSCIRARLCWGGDEKSQCKLNMVVGRIVAMKVVEICSDANVNSVAVDGSVTGRWILMLAMVGSNIVKWT